MLFALDLAIKNAVEKHPHGPSKAIVYKIQDDKGQDKYPKHIDHDVQHFKGQP